MECIWKEVVLSAPLDVVQVMPNIIWWTDNSNIKII